MSAPIDMMREPTKQRSIYDEVQAARIAAGTVIPPPPPKNLPPPPKNLPPPPPPPNSSGTVATKKTKRVLQYNSETDEEELVEVEDDGSTDCIVTPPAPLSESIPAAKAPGYQHAAKRAAYSKQRERFGKHREFMQTQSRNCKPTAVLVWCALWDEERDWLVKGMSEKTLARYLGRGVRTIERAIAELEEKGYIRIVKRGGIGKGASVYELHSTPCK